MASSPISLTLTKKCFHKTVNGKIDEILQEHLLRLICLLGSNPNNNLGFEIYVFVRSKQTLYLFHLLRLICLLGSNPNNNLGFEIYVFVRSKQTLYLFLICFFTLAGTRTSSESCLWQLLSCNRATIT